jgi:hypothetical protein
LFSIASDQKFAASKNGSSLQEDLQNISCITSPGKLPPNIKSSLRLTQVTSGAKKRKGAASLRSPDFLSITANPFDVIKEFNHERKLFA